MLGRHSASTLSTAPPMYLPAHFAETRPAVLQAMLREHPLGLLITQDTAGQLQADPVPFVYDADEAGGPGVLRGHVARANPVWRETRPDVPAVVVFQGPQAYVSPSFYPAKREHGRVVPTWNYIVVEARGTLRAIEEADWLRREVGRLTERHEAARVGPWAVDDAPAPFVDTLLGAIVGIELVLDTLVGKWKASQNRPAADREGVAAGLRADRADALAAIVAGDGTLGAARPAR